MVNDVRDIQVSQSPVISGQIAVLVRPSDVVVRHGWERHLG